MSVCSKSSPTVRFHTLALCEIFMKPVLQSLTCISFIVALNWFEQESACITLFRVSCIDPLSFICTTKPSLLTFVTVHHKDVISTFIALNREKAEDISATFFVNYSNGVVTISTSNIFVDWTTTIIICASKLPQFVCQRIFITTRLIV